MTPKASVIVPVYNVERYLSKCLDSIVNQTLSDIEIICVNDGSQDGSAQILESYANRDSRIKIITQNNRGLSAARNTGMKVAVGKYIGFVDSDDWIEKDFYEKLFNAAETYQADIAAANIIKEKSDKKRCITKYFKIYCTDKTDKKFELLKIPKFCYVWNKIYNRENLIKNNIWFEENIKYEDVDFTHRTLYYLNKLVILPDTAYHYRINENGLSFNNPRESEDYKRAFNKGLKFVLEKHIHPKKMHRYVWNIKKTYKIFNIPIFTVLETDCTGYIYLFNKIRIGTININKFNSRTPEKEISTKMGSEQ